MMTKQDGTNLPAGADLSVVNYLPCSLWKQVECSINNTEVVDQSSGSFAFKSYLEALLCYGSEAKNTHLKTSFYYRNGVLSFLSNEICNSVLTVCRFCSRNE